MKIVVIGGTGLIGTKLVHELLQLDHLVIPASPQTGVNTLTGVGLNEVLKDADVVVDVSNSPVVEGEAVQEFFRRSTFNLVTAEAYAGVKHHVILSVVGVDRLKDSEYFRAKLLQEELVKLSGVPYTILRSTQFFELADRIAQAATIGEEVYISPAPFQPVASEEVVRALVNIVSEVAVNGTREIAGPDRMPMYELIRYYLNATEDSRQLVMDETAKYFGAELNDESLVPGENAMLGKIKYEHWFHDQLVFQ